MEYTHWKVKRRGKQDGRDWRWKFFPFVKDRDKQSDPQPDQEEPAQFENDLLAAARLNLARVQEAWSKIDKGLLEACGHAKASYDGAKIKYDKETAEHKKEIEAYAVAKQEYEQLKTPPLSSTVYWALFLVITAAEVLFNASIFDIFGFEEKWHTYLAALGIMVAIPTISHIIGVKLREDKKDPVEIFMMSGLMMVLIAGFAGITIWREKFFTGTKVLESVGIGTAWEPSSMMLTFFVVNLLIFAAILGMAFEAGHRDPEDYKTKKQNYERAAAALKNEGREAEAAASALLECSKKWRSAHSAREGEHYKSKSVALREVSSWTYLIDVYRSANMLARQNKQRPKSFNTSADKLVQLPTDLTTLQGCTGCNYSETFAGEEEAVAGA